MVQPKEPIKPIIKQAQNEGTKSKMLKLLIDELTQSKEGKGDNEMVNRLIKRGHKYQSRMKYYGKYLGKFHMDTGQERYNGVGYSRGNVHYLSLEKFLGNLNPEEEIPDELDKQFGIHVGEDGSHRLYQSSTV